MNAQQTASRNALIVGPSGAGKRVLARHTAIHNAKDPYLSQFYWWLRNKRNKPHKVAIVATARKLLVALFNMLRKNEPYDPPEVSA